MLKRLFYPSGNYHPKYSAYLGWSFLSNVVVSTESAMGAHSMLVAIGNDSESLRTINYIGKDIIGQLGALGYISNMSRNTDKDPHRFAKYSHIIQQSSFVAMFITPLVPSYFLPVAGVSNILTNISFAGFGAINAMCIQRIAMDNNIGEVYAKISIINTIGSSVGLAAGVAITVAVPDHGTRLCLTPLLAVLRIYTMNRAIRVIIP
jgi:hypothetical protein